MIAQVRLPLLLHRPVHLCFCGSQPRSCSLVFGLGFLAVLPAHRIEPSCVTSQSDTHRDRVVQLVGRPLLFVLWVLVFWGTFYGAIFLYEVAIDGQANVVRRVVSGKDVIGGVVNLGLVGFAALTWILVALAVWRFRSRAKRLRREELERRQGRELRSDRTRY